MKHHTMTWTPRAKQRPRTTYTKGNPRTYTPKETVAAELALARQWPHDPVSGPIRVEITMDNEAVHVLIEPCEEHGSSKLRGDIDNYSKLVMEALNGVAWVDDKQIVTLIIRKT